MARQSPVIIIGAGVAGLTLAQGLRLRSVPFRLFERHPQSHLSQGHRIRISKEAQSALNSVLSPRLQSLFVETAADKNQFEPRYVDATKLNYPEPIPAYTESMPLDRTWIRNLLFDDAVEYGKEFQSYEVVDGQVNVEFTDGSIARGRMLVGADGVNSRVRKQLQPDRRLLDLERWIIWGRTLLTPRLKERLRPDLLTWCMYLDDETNVQAVVEPMLWSKSVPDFHVHDYVYWCICAAPRQFAQNLPKTSREKAEYLESVSVTWHPDLKLLIDSAALQLLTCMPVLSSKPHIEINETGQADRITLIGDAAHPMSPMGGSGADSAICNAADLAQTIAEGVTRYTMRQFESRMEERAKVKIEHSFRGGQKFWQGKEWTEYSEAEI